MIENISPVNPDELIGMAETMKSEGYRLVTYTAADLDENLADIIYHFDKDLVMKHFRLTIPKDQKVPSLSGVFFTALLVENEIQDQYGILFDGLVIDYGQHLYLEEEVQRTPFCRYGVVKKVEPLSENENKDDKKE